MLEPDGYAGLKKCCRDSVSALFTGIRIQDSRPVYIRHIYANEISPSIHEQIIQNYKHLKTVSPEFVTKLLDLKNETSSPKNMIIIYEKAREETLQACQNGQRFQISDFLHIANQLATAVKSIHQLAIPIKALSPSMIFYNPAGRSLRLDVSSILFNNLYPDNILHQDTPFETATACSGLSYISPEQTGRLNCPVDYRTDFYSLGIIFYELLTGKLPFDSEDPSEIIHSHLARHPVPPSKIWVDIPGILSNITMKLLAKIPDDRYQSTYGILADIHQCRMQYQNTGSISSFALGSEDLPEQIHISQKLFGRENEFSQMMEIFERIRNGSAELLLISGFPGIGKSRLVHEMDKQIAEATGYFGIGKYDPFQKNFPYSAIIQAFQEVIRQILTESANRIQSWEIKLREALGSHGQIMINVIPEIELIIGPQPPAPEMSPPDAQNRFHQMFERFIQAFAQKEHPLVIFLDDIHWIDSASLKLIERILSTSAIHHCFFIGAFRNNELAKNKNLSLAFLSILKNNFPVTMMNLEGIEEEHVRQIIITSLSKNVENINPLAAIINRKTGGNPFFIGQFIQALSSKKLLCLDYTSGMWRWDEQAIQSENITDNVVAIMLDEIQKLPAGTQEMMKLAACIGNRFDFQILAAVSEIHIVETASLLLASVKAGFILAKGESNRFLNEILASRKPVAGQPDPSDSHPENSFFFEFLHDRVRQAVYSLVPIEQRKTVHFHIGKLMLNHMKKEHFQYNIFNLVNQLNYGVDMIATTRQQIELAELNLTAGRKAKESTAYPLALSYLITGVSLLPKTSWIDHYQLSLDLFFEKMECEYLNQDFEAANNSFITITGGAHSSLDKAYAFNIKMIMFAGQARHQEAVKIGLDGLRSIGVNISEPGGMASVLLPLFMARIKMQWRRIPKLVNLPEATDPRQKLIMTLLMNISFSAYLCNPYLIVIVALQIIDRTMKYGNTHASSIGYMIYGAILCAIFKQYERGNRFGNLGLQIQEKFGRAETNSKIFLYYGMGICPWQHPIHIAIKSNRNGLANALETGDCNWAVYHIQSILIFLFAQGTPLAEIYSECESYYDYIAGTKDSAALNYLISLKQVIQCLKGHTQNEFSLDDHDFSEENHVRKIIGENIHIILLRHYLLKMRLLYIMGDMDEALRPAMLCEGLLQYHLGTIIITEYYFFHSLILLAKNHHKGFLQKLKTWRLLKRNEKAIAGMARACPDNFEHKLFLIKAETARVQGKNAAAAAFFQKAIQSARQNGFIHMEAIANELAAKLFLAQGFEKVGKTFLAEAADAYRRWGADAKIKMLSKQYPSMTARITGPSVHPPIPNRIDYTDVVHSLQAISTEIVLDNLLQKLMQIVIRNAGARKGFFLLKTDNQLEIKAAGHIGNPIRVTLQSSPVENRTDMLLSAINYVQRTGKTLVMDDAARQGDFATDPYMIQAGPKSVLCLPILRQSELIAILYLENDIAIGAFTPDRIETLQLIASQAAISFENAKLYAHVIQKERDLRTVSEKLRSLSSELLLTEERERRRIAVDLHDRIGHALANVRIQLGLLQEAKGEKSAAKILQTIHDQIDQSISDTQSLTFELSPPVLYDLGLEAAIEWLVYQMNEQHGIQISFSDDHKPKPLGEDIRILIFQATRELLFNIVKHAQAHHAWVSIQAQLENVRVAIEDDGIGFEMSKAGYMIRKGGGFGLFSIQERLKYQGGVLDISSKPGHGTRITMTLPMKSNDMEK
ncbi:MAG: GAF domain-containing protein [Desulfobacteraceae bacterium]|nr:MAG: GAF domain-containing protein [Desulfobacteraceae bacterium]